MDYEDIFRHVTEPERVFLFEQKNNGSLEVLAMGSYNRALLSGIPCLIVEGIAIDPLMQGRGIFKEITEMAINQEAVICLRTQNPRMYRALEKYCSYIYPNEREMPLAITAVREELAKYLRCKTDEKGIVKKYYGGLFYGEEPKHEKAGELFNSLGIKLHNGDALLVVGVV
jgi:hypothetical protein